MVDLFENIKMAYYAIFMKMYGYNLYNIISIIIIGEFY